MLEHVGRHAFSESMPQGRKVPTFQANLVKLPVANHFHGPVFNVTFESPSPMPSQSLFQPSSRPPPQESFTRQAVSTVATAAGFRSCFGPGFPRHFGLHRCGAAPTTQGIAADGHKVPEAVGQKTKAIGRAVH